MLAFTRNAIYRLIMTGPPSSWGAAPESLIEETTEYGLLAEKTLKKVGDTLFWLSEAGFVRWDRRGLVLLSKNRIGIEYDTASDFVAFFVPTRNQIILHRIT